MSHFLKTVKDNFEEEQTSREWALIYFSEGDKHLEKDFGQIDTSFKY